MIVAHLSELHLGFRAYDRTERGRNVRERDVAAVLERAVQELGRLRPDLVVVAGDIFDRADPPPSAFLSLTRGIDALRSLLPDAPVLLAAGARDTPLRPGDATALAVVESLPGVEVATGTVRSVHLPALDTHVTLVPYRAGLREPYPVPTPEPRARHNVLVAYGSVGRGPGPRVDPAAWDYVALGGEHSHHLVTPHVAYAGALERVGGSPWSEVGEEKGFVTFDIGGGGRVRFHALPVRPIVSLAPVRTPPSGPGELPDRVREVTREVPGGLEDKIVRLRVQGVRPRDILVLQGPLLAELSRRAFHLDIEVEPGPRTDTLPDVPERLREALEASPSVAARVAALLEKEPEPPPPSALRARVRESDPLLGDVDVRLPEGVLGVVSNDASATHRLLHLLAGTRRSPPSPWIDPASSSPDVLAGAVEDVLVRLVGLGPIEAVRARLAAHAGREDDPGRDLAAVERRLAELEGADHALRELERELRELRADHAEVAGDLEEATMEWLRERQDAETHLHAYRDRARELKVRLGQIEESGADAPCPTCGRTLQDHFDEVLDELREEWESVVQDGTWWKRRREQLDLKPDPLQELEGRSLRLQAATEGCAERVEAARSRVRERDELRERRAELTGGDDGDSRGPGGSGDPRGLAEAVRMLDELVEGVRETVRSTLLDRASRYVAAVTGSRVLAFTATGDGGVRLEGVRGPLSPADEEVAAAEVALRLAGVSLAAEHGAPVAGAVLPTSLVERLREDDRLHLLDALPALRGRVRHILVGMRADTAERRHEVLDAVLEVRPGGASGPALRWLPAGPSRIVLVGEEAPG